MKKLALFFTVCAACAATAGVSAGGITGNSPIGVFDSGIGGLTVLEKLLTVDVENNADGTPGADGIPDLAKESFVYFGDQANMPYGLYEAMGKVDFLRELIVRDAQFLMSSDRHAPAKIIVIACNTATAYGYETLCKMPKKGDIRVIGVVNAGVEAALDELRISEGSDPVGIAVMATPGTIASGAYERTIRSALKARGVTRKVEIENRKGWGLAEAVENGLPGTAECARTNLVALVESYAARGAKAPIKAFILGCTHYPFVQDVFVRTFAELRNDPRYAPLIAPDVEIIDPAVYAAIACRRALKENGLLANGEQSLKAFISVGKNGPLSHKVKYGRNTGSADIGTRIEPMSGKTVPFETFARVGAFLPATRRLLAPSFGTVFRVKPGQSVANAVQAARDAGGINEIVFAPGDYHFSRTLYLDERDSGLTLRAEKPGKTVFYGGMRLEGWRPDGDGLWAVDLPDVKSGKLDFRTLVVNGRLAERAVWPGGTNTLDNLGNWKVRLLPALAGWWERPPTQDELKTMPYKPGDLPKGFDAANAEVRCYHMWSDSLLRVASNDTERSVMYFTHPAAWPAGACNRRKYVVYNIREGMKEPGQWYLDRTAGKVVYRPLPGEDMKKLKAVAPCLQTILCVLPKGRGKTVSGITVSGISFQATTPPYGRCGFGAGDVPAAVVFSHVKNVLLSGLEVKNVGGMGLMTREFVSSKIVDSVFTDTGACAVGFRGHDSEISGCRILRTGRVYNSACGMSMGGKRLIVRRNEIAETPYSGVIMGGSDNLLEENLVRRVMRVLHDGAAFYGGISRCTLRGNVVRDVVEQGKGFGASAYYIDEGGTDNVVERNVAEGVPMPVHNHITRNTRVTDNFFITEGDMTISFQNSIDCAFERNTLVVGKALRTLAPNAVRWNDNRVFKPRKASDPSLGFYIGNGKPANPVQKPKGALVSAAITNGVLPVFDGEVKNGEWAGRWSAVNRDATHRTMGGAPAHVRVTHDAENLYVIVQVTSFRRAKLSSGHEWGTDDAVQIELGPVVLRAFIDGTVTCSDPSLLPKTASYAGLAKKKRGTGNLQLYAFRIPRAETAAWTGKDGYIPFNVRVFASEHRETRYYETPSGDTPASRLRIKE